MDYTLPSTLRHSCLVKIAIQFWNRDDFPVVRVECRGYLEVSDEQEVKALERVQKLALPEQLEPEVSLIIKPIGSAMLNWFQYLHHHYRLTRNDPRDIRWTPQGTVDHAKTVAVLISDQSLSLAQRYDLACNFCLVDQITVLWGQLSPKQQYDWKFSTFCSTRRFLPIYWAYFLTDDLAGLRRKTDNLADLWRRMAVRQTWGGNVSVNKFGFLSAVTEKNVVAAKYFYAKLKPEEIDQWLFSPAQSELIHVRPYGADLLRFLLSRMNHEHRVHVLTKQLRVHEFCIEGIFLCLLQWPYQGFFLPTVNGIWEFISPRMFVFLLSHICHKMDARFQNYCTYVNIAREFWLSCSVDKRRLVIDRQGSYQFYRYRSALYRLFAAGQEQLCRLMLSDANAAQKDMLVVEEPLFHLTQFFGENVNRGQSRAFFKFLLAECGASPQKIDQFIAIFSASSVFRARLEQREEYLRFISNISSRAPR